MLSTDSSLAKNPPQPATKKFLTENDIFHSVRSAVIASRLVNKEQYAPALAMAVVGEYLRFLLLKTLKEDWNDDVLFPSPQVHLAWQQHILSTGSYVEECKSICGRILHHDPDGELDTRKKRIRYARTLVEYERVFGSAPRESIWPRENAIDPENESSEPTPTSSAGPPPPAPPSSSAPIASSRDSSSLAVPAASVSSNLAASTSSASLHTSSTSRRSSNSDHADANEGGPLIKKERIDDNVKVKEERAGKDEYYTSSSRDESSRRPRDQRDRDRDRNYDEDNNGNNKLSSSSSSSSLRGTKRRAASPDHSRNHSRRPTASPERTFDVRILSSPSTFELSLSVTNSTRISTVLQEYACRRRISHSDIRLMYYRDALDESKTVGECGLRKGSVLRAVFASKGD